MHFISDTSSSDLSDEEQKKSLYIERKMIRQRSDIFNLPDNNAYKENTVIVDSMPQKSSQNQRNHVEEKNDLSAANNLPFEIDNISKDQKLVAENFYREAVRLEQSGKAYDALPFYKKAIQIVPDIEKILYERHKVNNDEIFVGTQTSKALERTNAIVLKEVNLYEKFSLDVQNYGGRILLKNTDSSLLSTNLHISDLPPEILMYILRWVISSRQLDMNSLEKCSAVSKGMYLCARDDQLWRSACVKVWDGDINPLHHFKKSNNKDTVRYNSWRHMFIERIRVFYHGCYISKTKYLRLGENSFQDQYYRPIQTVEYFRYIRFLPNGFVLMMTSTEEPLNAVTRLRLTDLQRPDVLKGRYNLQQSSLFCVLEKQEPNQRSVSSSTSQKCTKNLPYDHISTTTYNMRFKIVCTPKRKFYKLVWQHYSVVQIRNGVDISSEFELNPSKYPPMLFSPVRSYHSLADSPIL